MIITSNTEFYNSINIIMTELNLIELSFEAVEIKNALEISAHPGEILGETRIVLKSLVKHGMLNILIKNNIKACIKYINRVL